MNIKEGICTGIGVIGSIIASAFGGWDTGLITLLIFMANELISIVENAGLMGLPLPDAINKAIDVLTEQKEG